MSDQEIHRQRLIEQLRRNPTLPPMPDGPVLECFKALDLAQALESEVNRANGAGHTKIQINMRFEDAIALASYLRRAVLLGA